MPKTPKLKVFEEIGVGFQSMLRKYWQLFMYPKVSLSSQPINYKGKSSMHFKSTICMCFKFQLDSLH